VRKRQEGKKLKKREKGKVEMSRGLVTGRIKVNPKHSRIPATPQTNQGKEYPRIRKARDGGTTDD